MSAASAPDGSPPRVRRIFTRRGGGVSSGHYASLNLADHVGDRPDDVARNRALLASRFGLDPEGMAIMQAAHGRDVATVAEGGTVPAVDGLVTDRPGLALLALAADCATVALWDPEAGVIAAVHSGWRGVAANAAGAAVEAMVAVGAEARDITAEVGPVICPGCYEVSAQVRDEVADAAPAAAARTRSGTPAVDLHRGIRQQLVAAGVGQVRLEPGCTFETDDLFSYRRDPVTGRHGMAIALVGD